MKKEGREMVERNQKIQKWQSKQNISFETMD